MRFVCFLLFAAPAVAQETGTIVGVVRFTGAVPAAKKILLGDGATILHRDLVVQGESKGLLGVAVHVEIPPAPLLKGMPRAVIDQRDSIFLPRVIALQEGQEIRFENNDLQNHGVQAFSTKPENTFNVTTPANRPFDFRFKAQKHPILLGCPLHGWMRAWIFVFEHPAFAVTDKKGEFAIANVPAGKQTVVFRHPDTGLSQRLEAEVRTGQSVRVEVEWKSLPNP